MTEEVKKEEVKKKGPLEKLKEFSHDKEEQMENLLNLCETWYFDLVWRDFNFELCGHTKLPTKKY